MQPSQNLTMPSLVRLLHTPLSPLIKAPLAKAKAKAKIENESEEILAPKHFAPRSVKLYVRGFEYGPSFIFQVPIPLINKTVYARI